VARVDCFRELYARRVKQDNIAAARACSRFTFADVDLLATDLAGIVYGADFVFHLAARSGL
jgi:hypothetical protein